MRLATILTCCLLGHVLCAQSSTWLPDPASSFLRQEHAMVEFNGRLWLMGGCTDHTYSEGYYFSTLHTEYNDIWSSLDGTNWRRELATAPWAGRSGHTLTVFDNRIWVIGGRTDQWLRNDVWSSMDGINWTQQAQSANWAARHNHTTVGFNGKLYVIGGMGAQCALNDVWSSTDGATWTQETASAPWSARSAHTSAVFGGRAWVMGGEDAGGVFKHDVWSSTNGANWTLEIPTPPWLRRTEHASAVFDNKLWISGGICSNIQWENDVWSSPDGVNWTQHAAAPWLGREGHALATFGSQLRLIGGFDAISGEHRRGIWSSPDGDNWTQSSEHWSGRTESGSTVFNNRLWVIGGSYKDDVWSTADGVNWSCATTQATGTQLGNHSVVAFNNRLWILGGEVLGQGLKGKVYSSLDGVTWTLEATNAWPIYPGVPNSGALAYSRALVHNGRIWMIGGMTIEYGYTDRIWSSADGVNWVLEARPAFLEGRAEFAACEFNGRMWVLCGVGGNVRDVWSSADGITWTQECANAPFMACCGLECVAHNGKMWVLGGCAINGLRNEAWSSPDGINWTLETTGPWDRRWYHTAQSFNGGIYLMGGWTNEVTSTQENGIKANDVWCMVGGAAPQLTSTPATTAVAGIAYNSTLTASGSPAPGFHAGGLPAWLSFDPQSGTLSGTPGMADVGVTSAILVSAVNEVGVDSQSFLLSVAGPAPVIVSVPVTGAIAGVPYSYTVQAVGGPPAPALSASGLPGWLAFNSSTGELSGTPGPADVGLSGDITITASNGTPPDAVQVFQILVAGTPAAISSVPPTEAHVGTGYTYTLAASGLPVATLTAAQLPAWLSFDPVAGVLSGRPEIGDVGSSTVELRASTGWGPDAVQQFNIEVADPIEKGGGSDGAGCAGNAAGVTWGLVVLLIAALPPLFRRRRA